MKKNIVRRLTQRLLLASSVVLTVCRLEAADVNLFGINMPTLDFHGFISQGFLASTKYNYLPEGEGQQLASNLERAFAYLDTEFRKVQNLEDSDFAAAMKLMDQDIPPLTERVTAAANAFSGYGYHFSGEQADATFDSFGWIKKNAIMFGTANVLVAFGAVIFVLLAARRSRKQLEERTKELAESQSLYHSLVEQLPAGIFRKDAQGRFVFVNAWYCRIKGMKPEQILGKTPRELAAEEFVNHPQGAKEIQMAIQGANHHELIMETGKRIEVDEFYSGLDGKVLHMHVVKSPVFGADGKIMGSQGIFFDVTERKRAEAELAKERNLLRTMIENSPDAIYIKDRSGRKTLANPAELKNMGCKTEAEAIGKSDFEIYPQELAAGYFADDQSLIQSGQALINREEKVVTPAGETHWFLSSKIPLRDETGTIIGLIGMGRDITEIKQAQDTLRESEQRFSGAFNHASIGVALVSPDGRWLKVNRALCDLVGYSEAEMLARTFQDITHPEDLAADLENMRRLLAGEIQSYQMEKRYVHSGGHLVAILLNVSLVRDTQGRPIYFISQIQDITERKRLEARLFESQKMETVGKLAGGVAHEFNSILTAIIIQSDMLIQELPAGSPLVENAVQITQAAGRAATLTRQLLAFGRKQFLQPVTLDLNQIIAGMESVVRHLMGNGVATQIILAAGLHTVRADAGQIEQVVLNMVMNAHDAMPEGGSLTLETANVSFDEDSEERHPELKPGGYVMLAVTDTGKGMSEAVKARLFEPFFTTKDVGQGTGLGLSTCYGIIKQSGGHIAVSSEPGRGTTFKIYLPQVEVQAKMPVESLDSSELPRGTETILLVEDDTALRDMAATLLRRLGYTVFAAAGGVEALGHVQGQGQVDLLFADVTMPDMNGRELAERMKAANPQMKILFKSAYAGNTPGNQDMLDKGVALLQKPFTPSALANKLREVLD